MTKWTDEHEATARSQGWSIFTDETGLVEVNKIDDPANTDGCDYDEPKFESDEDALAFVMAQAAIGDDTALTALAIGTAQYE